MLEIPHFIVAKIDPVSEFKHLNLRDVLLRFVG